MIDLAAAARKLLQEKEYGKAKFALLEYDLDDDRLCKVCIIGLLALAVGISVDDIDELESRFSTTRATNELLPLIDKRLGCKLMESDDKLYSSFARRLYSLNDDGDGRASAKNPRDVPLTELLDLVAVQQAAICPAQ